MNALCISRKLRYRSEQHFDRLGKTRTATYDANNINQYTSIARNQTAFDPTFDTDGNQTLAQTSTGIWTVAYNTENRPISFTKIEADQTTLIECGYDYMGRRSMKKVTVNGTITLHHRYIYRGYLQIACVDLLRGGHPALWYTLWDPTEPIATRPLAIQKNGTWYTYGHDLTKNVTELYKTDGTIATTYDYTPFGAVTVTGIDQPFQWSSEVYDSELALTYYNYRHYNPMDGRWINRDPIAELGRQNLYAFVKNGGIWRNDYLGNQFYSGYDTIGNSTAQQPNSSLTCTKMFIDWVEGQNGNTNYDPNSQQTQDMKKSEAAKQLREALKNKNKNAKCCKDWLPITGVRCKWRLPQLFLDCTNPTAQFVGSATGEASIKDMKDKKLTVVFVLTNTTSLKSFLLHIPPNSWNITTPGSPFTNWTQTYTWEETICTDKDNDPINQ